jgi:hypothetical protein
MLTVRSLREWCAERWPMTNAAVTIVERWGNIYMSNILINDVCGVLYWHIYEHNDDGCLCPKYKNMNDFAQYNTLCATMDDFEKWYRYMTPNRAYETDILRAYFDNVEFDGWRYHFLTTKVGNYDLCLCVNDIEGMKMFLKGETFRIMVLIDEIANSGLAQPIVEEIAEHM